MTTREVLTKYDTPIVFADTTDYSSTATGLARTDQIDLTSLGDTAARQSDQADLGANRQRTYVVWAGLEFASGITSDSYVDFYWAGSPSSSASAANPGGVSGSDSLYTGTSGDSLTDSLKQLLFIGRFVATADATTTVQFQQIGVLQYVPRYGTIVVHNQSGVAFHSDAVEMLVALMGFSDELQSEV